MGAKDVPGGAGDAGGTAPAPAAGGAAACATPKTIDVFGINLPGANRTIFDDITKANAVWNSCCVKINVTGGQTWNTDVLDLQDPMDSLNEYSDPNSPTDEESKMLAHKPPSGSIPIYNVPTMSAGSRGEAFLPGTGGAAAGAVVVSDSAAVDTFAHELGHVLLSDLSHHADPDNLMATGDIRNVGVDKLEKAQCDKV
jgi:hypothetical protein